MNTRNLLVLTCLATLVAAGCKPQTATESDTAAPAAVAVAVAPADAPVAAPVATSAALSTKAFAGTFSGTLPCADCAGTDTTLALDADGGYQLSETRLGQTGEPIRMDGSWTAEADNRHVRLDPNSKADPDRLYAITDHDRLTPLGADGKPLVSSVDQNLKRQPAAQ